ncbi:MAG: hypothetical protein PIR53_15100 [Nocardioides alkalitolerans]
MAPRRSVVGTAVSIAVAVVVVAVIGVVALVRGDGAEEPEVPEALARAAERATVDLFDGGDGLPADDAERLRAVLVETPWSGEQAARVATALPYALAPDGDAEDPASLLTTAVTVVGDADDIQPALADALLATLARWPSALHATLGGAAPAGSGRAGAGAPDLPRDDLLRAIAVATREGGGGQLFATAYGAWAADVFRGDLEAAVADAGALDASVVEGAGSAYVGAVRVAEAVRDGACTDGVDCWMVEDALENALAPQLLQVVVDAYYPDYVPPGLSDADGRPIRLDLATMTPDERAAYRAFYASVSAATPLLSELGEI